MKESSMNVIELPDVKHSIFLFILEYLYTDQIGNTHMVLKDMYTV
jgi:hypothetical protein